MGRRRGIDPIFLVALALALLLGLMPYTRPFFAWAFPGIEPPVYDAQSYLTLWWSHAWLVAGSSLASTFVGLSAAIFVTRPAGRDFRALLGAVATIGQSFPPVAVLALAVPVVGYGQFPTFIALALYGFLPIVENAIAGLEAVPASIRAAADGMGLSGGQRLRQVELPLAAPAILAGIRVSVIVNIGTAAIGSTVGAVTLGTPIIDGLVTNKLPYVLQGAAVVGLFAVLVDMGFERLDRRLRRYRL